MNQVTNTQTSTKTASNFVPTEAQKQIAEIYEHIQKIHFSEKNIDTEYILRDLYTQVRFLQQPPKKEVTN